MAPATTTDARGINRPDEVNQAFMQLSSYRRVEKGGKTVFEHRWIMEQHLGRKLEVSECIHHINGNGMDNRIENLQIVSRAEHARLHYKDSHLKRGGVPPVMKGSKNPMAKLNERTVKVIKERLSAKESIKAIACDYGVSSRTISKIRAGTKWAHVK